MQKSDQPITYDGLTYSLAPENWAIYFQHDCPMADKCLYHAIALLAPEGLTHHDTVLPAARRREGSQFYIYTIN